MFSEHHYKPTELGKLWGFHADKIREWFHVESGVLIEHHPEQLHKRGYKSMRIPASVAARVYAKHISK